MDIAGGKRTFKRKQAVSLALYGIHFPFCARTIRVKGKNALDKYSHFYAGARATRGILLCFCRAQNMQIKIYLITARIYEHIVCTNSYPLSARHKRKQHESNRK